MLEDCVAELDGGVGGMLFTAEVVDLPTASVLRVGIMLGSTTPDPDDNAIPDPDDKGGFAVGYGVK